jgi:hypothetical protein
MAPEQCPEKNVGIFISLHRSRGAHCDADIDTVTLKENLVIKNQSIGVASSAQGFSDVDGILGWVTRPENQAVAH